MTDRSLAGRGGAPEVRWERMFPDELEAAFDAHPVVYFPYGLCEPHGPQNAVGLDALKAHAIAVRAAQAHGGIVAPPDYWHVHEIAGYAAWAAARVGEVPRTWTTSVPPWHHFKSVLYHVRTADQLGFAAAIFLTGHYGPNWQDLKTLLELVQPQTKTQLYGLPDFEANQPGFARDGASGGDHAGRVETSLLLALEPGCVDLTRLPNPQRAEPGGPDTGSPANAYREPPYFAMGADARQTDRRTGERMVADEVAFLGAKAAELLSRHRALDPAESRPGFPTFASVEEFWTRMIVPEIPGFASMEPERSDGLTVPPGSRWEENAVVPPPSTWGG